MAHVYTVPFHVEHLKALGPPVVQHSERYIEMMLAIQSERSVITNLARTAFVGEEAIAAYGGVELWEGVATGWVWFTPKTRRYLRSLVELIELHLRIYEEKLGFRRIQLEISTDLVSTKDLALLMGFQIEGIMRNYGFKGQGDYWLMARTS